jgi:hypothetical protein
MRGALTQHCTLSILETLFHLQYLMVMYGCFNAAHEAGEQKQEQIKKLQKELQDVSL